MSQLAHPARPAHQRRTGTLSIVMGALAVLGVAWAYYLTFGSAGPELSNVLRALGMALLPLGLLVGIPAAIMAVRHGGSDRTSGYIGLVVAAAAVAGFVVLLSTADY